MFTILAVHLTFEEGLKLKIAMNGGLESKSDFFSGFEQRNTYFAFTFRHLHFRPHLVEKNRPVSSSHPLPAHDSFFPFLKKQRSQIRLD